MQSIKHISIPQPCHEDWQQMTPVAQGRHCQSCCKTVMDFTAMSNADIIGYLATHSNTCGRISGPKLAAINNELHTKKQNQFSWKGFIAAASLSVLFPAVKAGAQSTPKTEQASVSTQSFTLGKIAPKDTVAYITITGVVRAKDDKLPVPAATVVVKGTKIGTQTLKDGTFTLRVPTSAKRIVVSFLGYQTQEIRIRKAAGKQVLVLNPVLETAWSGMFDIIYQKQPLYKRGFYAVKELAMQAFLPLRLLLKNR